jgi:hypothetical protein
MASRNYFQFGINTLLALTTLVAITIGWEARYINERRVMRQRISANGGLAYCAADSKDVLAPLGMITEVEIPFWRQWLGDEPIGYVSLCGGATDAEFRKVRMLFPEAQLCIRQP